jgi:hypothetical protein
LNYSNCPASAGETLTIHYYRKKISDALEVSLDYLTVDTKTPAYDKKTLQRLEDLQQLDEPKRQTLFDVMHTKSGMQKQEWRMLRNFHCKKQYTLLVN